MNWGDMEPSWIASHCDVLLPALWGSEEIPFVPRTRDPAGKPLVHKRRIVPSADAFNEDKLRRLPIVRVNLDADWMYSHRGIFAFTVELWDLPTAAGITEKNEKKQFIEWMRKHPQEDDLQIFDFINEVAPEHIIPWYTYDHPQLGSVELGGFQTMYTWRNPPPSLLEAEIAPQADFVIAFSALAPRLAWRAMDVEPLGDDTWRILGVVENSGFLSTSGSERARSTGLSRPVRLEIELPEGVELVSGTPRVEVGHLEGRSNKLAGGWFSNSATDNRGKAEWVVRGAAGASVRVVAHAERAGSLRTDVTLQG